MPKVTTIEQFQHDSMIQMIKFKNKTLVLAYTLPTNYSILIDINLFPQWHPNGVDHWWRTECYRCTPFYFRKENSPLFGAML